MMSAPSSVTERRGLQSFPQALPSNTRPAQQLPACANANWDHEDGDSLARGFSRAEARAGTESYGFAASPRSTDSQEGRFNLTPQGYRESQQPQPAMLRVLPRSRGRRGESRNKGEIRR